MVSRKKARILVARSDRSFKFKIDDVDLEWPQACISGFALRKLAKLPANYNLWQEIPGQHDKKITDTDVINLADVGVERFVSLIDQTTEEDGLVRGARHPGRAGDDGQWLGLPVPSLRRRTWGEVNPAYPDKALHAADQREGRAVHPDPDPRMGLREHLQNFRPAKRRSATLY